MRAIIIEEQRFTDFLELLRLKSDDLKKSNTPTRLGWDKQIWNAAVDGAHRELQYKFVEWARSHGASCV